MSPCHGFLSSFVCCKSHLGYYNKDPLLYTQNKVVWMLPDDGRLGKHDVIILLRLCCYYCASIHGWFENPTYNPTPLFVSSVRVPSIPFVDGPFFSTSADTLSLIVDDSNHGVGRARKSGYFLDISLLAWKVDFWANLSILRNFERHVELLRVESSIIPSWFCDLSQ